nr:replicase [Hibiscus green spot virus 2]
MESFVLHKDSNKLRGKARAEYLKSGIRYLGRDKSGKKIFHRVSHTKYDIDHTGGDYSGSSFSGKSEDSATPGDAMAQSMWINMEGYSQEAKENIRRAADAAITHRNPLFESNAQAVFNSGIETVLQEKLKKRPIVLPHRVPSKVQQDLVCKFVGMNMKFTSVLDHNHAVAAVLRVILQYYMLAELGYEKYDEMPSGYDSIVKDVGGNVLFHIKQEHIGVHSCFCDLGGRDCSRQAALNNYIRYHKCPSSPLHKHMCDSIQAGSTNVFCRSRGEVCHVRAPFMVFNHSAYDMTPEAIVDCMIAADSVKALISLHYNEDMFRGATSGKCEALDSEWHITKVNGRLYYNQVFRGCVQAYYTHDLAIYLSKFTTKAVLGGDNRAYIFEVKDVFMNTAIIEVNRLESNCLKGGRIHFPLPRTVPDDVHVLYTYDFMPGMVQQFLGAFTAATKWCLKPKRIEVSSVLFDQVMRYIATIDSAKFTITTVTKAVVALMSRRNIGGTYITGTSDSVRIAPKDMFSFCVTCYLIGYEWKYNATQCFTAVKGDIDWFRKRSASSGIVRCFSKLCDKLASKVFGDGCASKAGKHVWNVGDLDKLTADEEVERRRLVGDSFGLLTKEDDLTLGEKIRSCFSYQVKVHRKFPIEVVTRDDTMFMTVEIPDMLLPDKPVMRGEVLTRDLMISADNLEDDSVYEDVVDSVYEKIDRPPSCCKLKCRVQSVAADGNCVFGAMVRVGVYPGCTVDGIKVRLRDSAHYDAVLDSIPEAESRSKEAFQRALCKDRAWATEHVLGLASLVFDVQFCIHRFDESNGFVSVTLLGRASASRKVHLKFFDGHFEVLIVKDAIGLAELIDPTVDGEYFGEKELLRLVGSCKLLDADRHSVNSLYGTSPGIYKSFSSCGKAELLYAISERYGVTDYRKALIIDPHEDDPLVALRAVNVNMPIVVIHALSRVLTKSHKRSSVVRLDTPIGHAECDMLAVVQQVFKTCKVGLCDFVYGDMARVPSFYPYREYKRVVTTADERANKALLAWSIVTKSGFVVFRFLGMEHMRPVIAMLYGLFANVCFFKPNVVDGTDCECFVVCSGKVDEPETQPDSVADGVLHTYYCAMQEAYAAVMSGVGLVEIDKKSVESALSMNTLLGGGAILPTMSVVRNRVSGAASSSGFAPLLARLKAWVHESVLRVDYVRSNEAVVVNHSGGLRPKYYLDFEMDSKGCCYCDTCYSRGYEEFAESIDIDLVYDGRGVCVVAGSASNRGYSLTQLKSVSVGTKDFSRVTYIWDGQCGDTGSFSADLLLFLQSYPTAVNEMLFVSPVLCDKGVLKSVLSLSYLFDTVNIKVLGTSHPSLMLLFRGKDVLFPKLHLGVGTVLKCSGADVDVSMLEQLFPKVNATGCEIQESVRIHSKSKDPRVRKAVEAHKKKVAATGVADVPMYPDSKLYVPERIRGKATLSRIADELKPEIEDNPIVGAVGVVEDDPLGKVDVSVRSVSTSDSMVTAPSTAGRNGLRDVVSVIKNELDRFAALDEAASYHAEMVSHDVSSLRGAADYIKNRFPRSRTAPTGAQWAKTKMPESVLNIYLKFNDKVGLIDATGKILKHSEPRVAFEDISKVFDLAYEATVPLGGRDSAINDLGFMHDRKDFQGCVGYYALFTSVTAHDQEPVLHQNSRALRLDRNVRGFLRDLKVEILDAAPGAGKTKYLVDNFTLRDMVVTSTKENRDEFRERLKKRLSETGVLFDPSEVDARVRTLNGFLIDYGSKRKYKGANLISNDSYCFIDEANMYHAGDVFSVAFLYKVPVLHCVGDRRQIPFISRLPRVVTCHQIHKYCDVTLKPFNRSFRSPVDIVARIQRFYPHMPIIEAHNEIGLYEPSAKVISVGPDVAYTKDFIATFFGHDKAGKHNTSLLFFVKEDLFRFVERNPEYASLCCTVHQKQGCESDYIIVFRLSFPDKSTYNDESQVVVALTRHRKGLVYATAGPDDRMKSVIENAPTLAEVKQHLPEDIRNKLAGGRQYSRDVYYKSVPSVSLMKGKSFFSIGTKKVLNVRNKWKYDIRLSPGFRTEEVLSAVTENKEQIDRAGHLVLDAAILRRLDQQVLKPQIRRICDVLVYASGDSGELDSTIFRIMERDGCEHTPDPELSGDLKFVCDDEEYVLGEDVLEEQVEVEELDNMPVDVGDYVGHLQSAIGSCFPSCTYHLNQLDSFITYKFDLDLKLEDMSLQDIRFVSPDRKYECMVPVLSHSGPTFRTACLVESLIAVGKRNRNVPKLDAECSPYIMADMLFDRFIDVYYRAEGFVPVHRGPKDVAEWCDDQENLVPDRVVGECSLYLQDLSVYNFITKGNPKVNLTDRSCEEFTAPQTVLFQGKDVNSMYCVIFRRIKKSLLKMLGISGKYFIYTDMDAIDFAAMLTKKVPPHMVKYSRALEIDISKYDKSQGLIALLFECKIMRWFGVEEHLVQLWFDMHMCSRVDDRHTSLKFEVRLQRRSGDAATLLGNTMFLMAVIAYHYKVEEMDLCAFAGDDSLLIGANHLLDTDATEFTDLFNLEVKFFRYEYYHFCSKFLIPVGDRWYFVPDPVKLLVKLARCDLRNRVHIEQYRVSYMDSVQFFCNDEVLLVLEKAVHERYVPSMCCRDWIKLLYYVAADPEMFDSLFEDPEGEPFPSGGMLPRDR